MITVSAGSHQAGAISLHGQWTAAGRIEAQLDRLLDKPYQTAIRLAVMARHLCGGSRTWNGAHIQQNLTSVLQTCQQQGKDSFDMLVDFCRNPQSKVLDLLPSSLSPPHGLKQLAPPTQ